MSSFYKKYAERRNKIKSVLCIGLDPDPELIPNAFIKNHLINGMKEFLSNIIRATSSFACAYKTNLAFYEAHGEKGIVLLKNIISIVREESPDSLVILDAKRADIGNTASFYAKSIFEDLKADAVTLSPYMGLDTLDPFLKYDDKAIIVLCNTSNEGAAWLQEYGNPPLYLKLAKDLQNHISKNKIWLVAGATRSVQNLESIRKVAPDLPLLIPGVGAQGGTITSVMKATGSDVLINVGRSIMYAGKNKDEVFEKARNAAQAFCKQMKSFL